MKFEVNRLAPATALRVPVPAARVDLVGRADSHRPGRRRARAAAAVAVVSCANWQAGYFSAYRHLAARGDLDVVLHLGDYLYEYAPGEYQDREVVVRPHDPPKEMASGHRKRPGPDRSPEAGVREGRRDLPPGSTPLQELKRTLDKGAR